MAEIFAPLADRFLSGEIKSLVVVCPENERPLLGIGGYVDHRLKRPISHALTSGFVTGKKGEVAYIPARFEDREYHLFILGCGPVEKPGDRLSVTSKDLAPLIRNLKSMKHFPVAVSKSDFGPIRDEDFEKLFSDIEKVS